MEIKHRSFLKLLFFLCSSVSTTHTDILQSQTSERITLYKKLGSFRIQMHTLGVDMDAETIHITIA